MNRCSAEKTNSLPCSIPADRLRGDHWFCHIHDPLGKYYQQHPQNKTRIAQPMLFPAQPTATVSSPLHIP